MTNLRTRIRQLEKQFGGNGKPRKVKIYVGDICPDEWPPEVKFSVERQLEMIEAGVRWYLCFESLDEAAEYGFIDSSPIEHAEQDPADIDDISPN